MQSLKAGVFAAGAGSRLRGGDAAAPPKALTAVADRTLIEWTLRDIEAAGSTQIVVIVNEASVSVRDHVARTMRPSPITWIVETTPSSMHSFLRVLETLACAGDDGPFLMATVDTIAPPGTFAHFVDAARRAPAADIVLALTTRIDDDNPLTVTVGPFGADGSADVVAIGSGPLATAGYYFVRASLLAEADAARRAGLPALRKFFQFVAARGYSVTGICMPASVDVDRPADVGAAEALLRGSTAVPR